MIVYQNYAFINKDTIDNIAIVENYHEANRLALAMYGKDGIAVDVTQYSVKKGDKYYDGHFYRVNEDGTEIIIEPITTVEQEVRILKEENAALLECVVENDYRLSVMELGL